MSASTSASTRRPGGCLRRLGTRPERPRATLVCFPHAGGNPTAFRGWHRRLPGVEVVSICYPGRLDRLHEDPPGSIPEMAREAAGAVASLAGPVALFGHSMGAYVAYETLRRLDRPPALLAVSGTRSPHRMVSRGVAQRGTQAVADDVVRLNRASAQVMEIPDLRELVLPAIAADYWAVERYGGQTKEVVRLDVPVRGYAGREDPIGPPAELRRWMPLTEHPLGVRSFPGGHFYLEEHQEALLADLRTRLRSVGCDLPEPAT